LDQEEAKKFLVGKAEDKYNFFLKATELDRVDRSYASTVDTVMELTEANDRIKDGLKQKMDRVDVLKKKYEEHLEVDRLDSKLQEMTVKYAWSYYNVVDEGHNNAVDVRETFSHGRTAGGGSKPSCS
jgi:chromosome segregation ATPase